jgi:hypothetical protein
MEKPDKTILRKDDKRTAMKIPRSRPIPNRLASFKFPPKFDKNVAAAYADRKVDVINKKKFVNRINRNPSNDFVGTLKLFS